MQKQQYSVDVASFQGRGYQITLESVLQAFPFRFDTPDGGCIICEASFEHCECTPAQWRASIDMEQLPEYLERVSGLKWLREWVVGDMLTPYTTQIGDSCIAFCAHDLEWAYEERDYGNGQCVYCLDPVYDPAVCKCTVYEWSLLDCKAFAARIISNVGDRWLLRLFLDDGGGVVVVPAPRKSARLTGKRRPDYTRNGEGRKRQKTASATVVK